MWKMSIWIPSSLTRSGESGTISMEGKASDLAADDRVRKAYLGA